MSTFKHPPVNDESRKRKLAHAKASLHIVPEGEPKTPQERGFKQCPCRAMKCPLRDDCHLCYANHVSHGGLPKCLRPANQSEHTTS